MNWASQVVLHLWPCLLKPVVVGGPPLVIVKQNTPRAAKYLQEAVPPTPSRELLLDHF